MPSLKVDVSGLKSLADLMDSGEIKQAFAQIPHMKAIVALVSQAIAENFAKEGPGWAPLSARTIRASVSKSLRKKLRNLTGDEIQDFERIARKRGRWSYSDESKIVEYNVKMNSKSRSKKQPKAMLDPNRAILQKTGLLKKTATIPSFTGSNKVGQRGSNVNRVEGTNLIYGTNLVYAATHQYGNPSKNIPKREFLVIREEWQKRIDEFVAQKAMDIIKKVLK